MGRKLRCKRCTDVIESRFRHDFVRCKCGAIFIDGGNDYTRMGGDMGCIEILPLGLSGGTDGEQKCPSSS